jgi:hypothetical protein
MRANTPDVFLKRARNTDIPLIAHMNKRLIEDEGHDNPMGITELQDNQTGIACWRKMGFAKRYIGLRLERPKPYA